MVLAMTMTPEQVSQIAAGHVDMPASRWPSVLYQMTACRALMSPSLWLRCEAHVGQALQGESVSVEMFYRDRAKMTGRQLAAVLWKLVAQDSPLLGGPSRILEEVQFLALNRLHEPSPRVKESGPGRGMRSVSRPSANAYRSSGGQGTGWLDSNSHRADRHVACSVERSTPPTNTSRMRSARCAK